MTREVESTKEIASAVRLRNDVEGGDPWFAARDDRDWILPVVRMTWGGKSKKNAFTAST